MFCPSFMSSNILGGLPMLRCLGTVVAGAIVCTAVGCWGGSFHSMNSSPTCERVVRGSVPAVSATLEAELADAGAVLLEKRQKEVTSLVGTYSGKLFILSLRPVKDKGSDRTAVVFNWGREADERFSKTVERVLAAMASAPEGDSKPAADE
jgi:hypothetical protein